MPEGPNEPKMYVRTVIRSKQPPFPPHCAFVGWGLVALEICLSGRDSKPSRISREPHSASSSSAPWLRQTVRGRHGTQNLPWCLISWALEAFLPGQEISLWLYSLRIALLSQPDLPNSELLSLSNYLTFHFICLIKQEMPWEKFFSYVLMLSEKSAMRGLWSVYERVCHSTKQAGCNSKINIIKSLKNLETWKQGTASNLSI